MTVREHRRQEDKSRKRRSFSPQIRMFVLVWVTLLSGAGGNHLAPGLLLERKRFCPNRICFNDIAKEIMAEAGLCAVIPCSFQLDSSLSLQRIEWYKNSKSSRKHVFRSDQRHGLKVSLLDLHPENCSIIINDLTEPNSGSYQVSVYGATMNSQPEELRNPTTTRLSVKALTQKPSMMTPTMTEGQRATLTCTAPGLCSGSTPDFTWTWGRTGEIKFPITENITCRVDSVGLHEDRYSSALSFSPSATQHHGTEITCKVTFANNIVTEETVTLTVRAVPRISKDSTCKVRSRVLTCVCISRGFPLPVISWPILGNLSRYSLCTTLAKQAVESTITVSGKDHNNTVQCVSSNELGRVQKDIDVIISAEEPEDVNRGSSVLLPWAVAAASLIVNVICIICVVILWNIRKKVEPIKEDRTYMSLDKTHPSQDYDVIGQPRS